MLYSQNYLDSRQSSNILAEKVSL